MAVHICRVCEYLYDDAKKECAWTDLDESWHCPVCESSKSQFSEAGGASESLSGPSSQSESSSGADDEYVRERDDIETTMSDIHRIARSGESIVEPMRTMRVDLSWKDIYIRGAQLASIPLNEDIPVSTETVIGPRADHPLVLGTPIIITHMSFGALSKEAKIALAEGSARVQTAMCSGEGGILPESLEAAHRYIFEFVPNQYSVTEENLKKVDGIEIKIGQSAKPGMGGHLPGHKVTQEIARIRGFKEGEDIISPAHFEDITTKEDLRETVDRLRERCNGKPIGVKFAAGHIEADLEVALFARPDFITIDGRAGATGAAQKFIKESASVPTIFAVSRARAFLDKHHADGVSLIITGGLRISTDFAKGLAMGADAVAIGTSALMAIGCQQYRVCNTGKCPRGIATQDPDLRARFDRDRGAAGLENFLRVSTEELRAIARLTGKDAVHRLSTEDLITTNSEISSYTGIEHA